MDDARWLLPVGIEEILPAQAWELERLRRALLDLYRSWGYELVIPPFVDYLDSLLTGTGRDLDAQTFKLIDQPSGRLLGIRADMTPQVARIDAHRLRDAGPTRLCYLGTVLHTRSDGFAGTRSPYQIGAEIYGHDGTESEVEILRLVLLTLATAGIDTPYLDLGHVGIYRGLARQAGLDREQELALFEIVQRKAACELAEALARLDLAPPIGDMLLGLIELNGDDALERAPRALAAAADSVHRALDHLRRVAAQFGQIEMHRHRRHPVTQLRGYAYKTGVVFAAFVPGWGQEIARGGRYDDIGAVFGRARPAVGFSADLKGLIGLTPAAPPPADAVFAPWSRDPALLETVARLRAAGERVVYELPGAAKPVSSSRRDRRLIERDGRWIVDDDRADGE